MAESKSKPEELISNIDYGPKAKKWQDPSVEFKRGRFNYGGVPNNVEYLKLQNPRKWEPTDEDWKLPEFSKG